MVVVPAVAMPAVRVPLNFYKTEAGNEPVLEWLRSLPVNERRAIGRELKEAQIGWPIGMPLCRPLGAGLYEIRNSTPGQNYEGLRLLCGWSACGASCTQKIPVADLAVARKRMKDVVE